MVTHCVNCGAPINPHVDKCEYCDSYYFTMGVKNKPTDLTIDIDSFKNRVLTINEARELFGLKPLNIYHN